jgi:hypothetical protein
MNTATDGPTEGDKPEHESDITQAEETVKIADQHDESAPPKSPLLTSHRISTASSLDEVNLMTSNQEEPRDGTPGPTEKMEPPPPLPPKDESTSTSSGLIGLSGSLPSLPWGAPPVNKNPPPVPPPPIARKPSGPFAWFSRSSTSTVKDVKSPSLSASRRNTATSVSTLASNLDQARDGDDISSIGSKKPRRNSLKDQFKMLRLREESLAPEADQTSARSGHASISQAGASPPIIPEEGESDILAAPSAPSPSLTHPGTRNDSVADASTPVDWEMWQQLVNNGPQALASSEELNAAIKRGIPQTIRGVIWQILADCQTAELEDTYRELVARGTAHDKDGRAVNGAETTSSRSSVRSHHSGSGSRSRSQTPSPSHEVDADKMAKEQASNEAERAKKAKSDAVALSKLEKIIRRDLGARTSYAKYFVSQGSQEGLFGLCKAYALYDEGVGYAQGMNFIAMPLLFNVSIPHQKSNEPG